ncbi:MAG: 2-dehydropantoate 2-reductase [Candidatus Omnitrophica bacterium]|nr:2-dehydropantoate 2-reductase [Candidatus Omnitrophota bacterium]
MQGILIYGAGAVGLGLASCILKSGVPVDILGREETIQALQHKGLVRTGLFGAITIPPSGLNGYTQLSDIRNQPYDFILVSTKSFDSEHAAQDIRNHPDLYHQNTKIILCQNGWGNAEIFTKHFLQKNIYNARIITGFYRPQPHEVEITVHADEVHLGSLFTDNIDDLQPLAQAINDGDLPCALNSRIDKDLWAKLLYNCSLNPLGAIFNVPYGQLKDHTPYITLMDQIIEEIFNVMHACGYQTHWETPSEYRNIFYNTLIPATASHYASTLQDLQARKRTEIDALNGSICRLSQSHNVPAPTNHIVYQMVKFLEQKNQHTKKRMT